MLVEIGFEPIELIHRIERDVGTPVQVFVDCFRSVGGTIECTFPPSSSLPRCISLSELAVESVTYSFIIGNVFHSALALNAIIMFTPASCFYSAYKLQVAAKLLLVDDIKRGGDLFYLHWLMIFKSCKFQQELLDSYCVKLYGYAHIGRAAVDFGYVSFTEAAVLDAHTFAQLRSRVQVFISGRRGRRCRRDDIAVGREWRGGAASYARLLGASTRGSCRWGFM